MTIQTIPLKTPNGLFNLNRLKNNSFRNKNIEAIRKLTQTAYQGNNITICRVLGRFMMFISNLDERHGVQLQMNGYWEMGVTELLTKLIKPGMNVIDIGANYGYFSFLMAELVRPKGHLYSIEANPLMCELINKSIKVNGYKNSITVINQAISDQNNYVESFSFSNNSPMNGALTANKSKNALDKNFHKQLDVQATTFDAIEFNNNSIDLIKIDIEGSENKFWFGSKKLRKSNPNLIMIMEFNRFKYKDADLFIDDIFSSGYKVWDIKINSVVRLDKKSLSKTPTNKHSMLLISKENILEKNLENSWN